VRKVLRGEPAVHAEIVTGTLRQRFFAATATAVRGGETSGAVLVLHDITELRKLERVRRDFVANVHMNCGRRLQPFRVLRKRFSAAPSTTRKIACAFSRSFLSTPASRAAHRGSAHALESDADRLELEIRRLSVSQFVEAASKPRSVPPPKRICVSP